jgi:lipoprotein-releasing system ATP-binding protein
MAAVEFQSVSKIYPGLAPGAPGRSVLTDFSLQIESGETVALVGRSGSGKSTVLNLCGTLDQPTSGEVRLFGLSINALSSAASADLRARKLGFVFQHHHLLPPCSVLENVLVPTLSLPSGDPVRQSAPARARVLLERVGLGGHLDHKPAQLSGGERQRAAVVRALINQPQLLLADEPTGALDAVQATALVDLLLQLNTEQGTTLIVVTHDLSVAQRLGRTVAL